MLYDAWALSVVICRHLAATFETTEPCLINLVCKCLHFKISPLPLTRLTRILIWSEATGMAFQETAVLQKNSSHTTSLCAQERVFCKGPLSLKEGLAGLQPLHFTQPSTRALHETTRKTLTLVRGVRHGLCLALH